MAPSTTTEDYYEVLELKQNATIELVIRSYKRLALKLHPDRNPKHDATQAFQLLGRAYETLKDENKRRAYDLIYPSIARSRDFAEQINHLFGKTAQKPRATSEEEQIAALQKSKQERGKRWWTKKNAFESSIFELQRDIRRLEQKIKLWDSVLATDAAAAEHKNSWGTWFMSPIYKETEDSEEEKERNDRMRQERMIEKDMKERQLEARKADLKREESLFKKAKEEVDSADLVDDGKIRAIRERISARETRDRERGRMERERMERERERVWTEHQVHQEQQEERDKWARERAAWEAAERRNSPRTHVLSQLAAHRQGSGSTCYYAGAWERTREGAVCPECYEFWHNMFHCPVCKMKACGACRFEIQSMKWTSRRDIPRARSRSPDVFARRRKYCRGNWQ